LAELLPEVDTVISDGLYDWYLGDPQQPERIFNDGGVAHEYAAIGELLRHPDFHLTAMQDGLLLFTRDGDPLPQEVRIVSAGTDAPLLATFGDQIGLVAAKVSPVAGRLRFEMTWRLLQPWPEGAVWTAVTHLGEAAHTRVVHLPVTTLAPPSTWNMDQLVHETFEIPLPPDLNGESIAISVGWYDAGHIFAPQTDTRSRIGEPFLIKRLTIR
jgi:hypothetical protein